MEIKDDSIPQAPAPWQLQGRAYICMLKASSINSSFNAPLSESLKDRRELHSHPLVMFVDYTHSPVGPYHELLFIPGYFKLKEGKKYLSITRIFVSSIGSVINGQRNWGIPKELAKFDVCSDEQDVDRVRVSRGGKIFADLTFNSKFLSFPFSTILVPKNWRTFIQQDLMRTYTFRPEAYGWIRPARIIKVSTDPLEFPSFNPEQVLATLKISSFHMKFPKASIHELKF